ncbi:pilus assembly protein PilQ [Xaviernesmea oryzae]|uniref:Pilus assembly protein PilQ n=1 Tax=Xaviernesmea oryzae TaxID=464029 RepID=A0A1Q9B2M9_9HYPH|nr:pilus assembly protein N-terminal domain-containing protein [Xaviernesmea oryzae]OLP62275.1 pilus assembly protein PilQ [Xaviernesmea oryzae]SEL94210.1 Pilus formation protein N terminal region [Xaviernesmea oryzae]
MTFSTRSRAFLLALPLALLAVGAARAESETPMRVLLNHARVLKLDRPVSKVIVGNSTIADATVADPRTIVLTGRTAGMTNLVILDSDDQPVVDERILVANDEENTLRLYRSVTPTIMSCTPTCELPATVKNN